MGLKSLAAYGVYSVITVYAISRSCVTIILHNDVRAVLRLSKRKPCRKSVARAGSAAKKRSTLRCGRYDSCLLNRRA